MVVCHACDEPLCCNPAHLWIGSQHENVHDCVSKRRHSHGEASATAKLTERQAAEVRLLMKSKTPRAEIASRYGVTIHALYRISGGYSWKHLGA